MQAREAVRPSGGEDVALMKCVAFDERGGPRLWRWRGVSPQGGRLAERSQADVPKGLHETSTTPFSCTKPITVSTTRVDVEVENKVRFWGPFSVLCNSIVKSPI